MPPMRVMESSAKIRTESVLHRRLCAENPSTPGQPNPFNQFFRIGHFQRHHFAGRERSSLQLSNPVRRVHAQDIFVACGILAQEIFFRSDVFAEKHFVNKPEFLRRKNVRPKIQIIALVIYQLEWKKCRHRPKSGFLFSCLLIFFSLSTSTFNCRLNRSQFSRSRMKSGSVARARAYSESERPLRHAFARRA